MTIRILLVLTTLGAAACAKHGQAAAPKPTDSVQVGYGAQPRDKTTGAVASISEDEMRRGRPMRIDELLRGKVSGLDIMQSGSTVTFRIRGAQTLRTDVEPLVLVDDVAIQSGNIINALA